MVEIEDAQGMRETVFGSLENPGHLVSQEGNVIFREIDNQITRRMAIGLVDELEAVDTDQDDRVGHLAVW